MSDKTAVVVGAGVVGLMAACARIAAFEQTLSADDRIHLIGDYLNQASINVAVITAERAVAKIVN